MEITITAHAQWRMAQRNIRLADLEYVLCYGRRIHGAGGTHVFLGQWDVPAEDQAGRGGKLAGTTVVIEGNTVVTVYRNRQGLRRLKKSNRGHR